MQLLNKLCEIDKHKYQNKITQYGFLPHILNIPFKSNEGKIIREVAYFIGLAC